MSKIDLTPFIKEDKGSEIIIELPCKENERAFFNGYQTWTPSFEVAPTDTHIGVKRFFRFSSVTRIAFFFPISGRTSSITSGILSNTPSSTIR